jgi:4-aminobutyrate aminotransferase-like enzyme
VGEGRKSQRGALIREPRSYPGLINLSASEDRDLSITAPLIITQDELMRGLDAIEKAVSEEWAEMN